MYLKISLVIICTIIVIISASLMSSTQRGGSYKVTTEAPKSQLSSRYILELTTEEKRKFLDSFDNVFSDIDGVVWNLNKKIEGSSEGFQELKNAGKNLTFITNNSVRTIQTLVDNFKELNIDIDAKNIVQPAQSIVYYLKSINFDGLIYVIAAETLKNKLREAGFRISDGPTEIIDESFDVLTEIVFDGQNVSAVVLDIDFNFSYIKLIKANLYLRNPNCLLIVGATDMWLPVHKDVTIIGPGPIEKVIAESSEKQMITLGKPGKDLADMILKRFNIKDTKRSLMIGDMLEQDVGFGKECGFQTLLVLSGGCTLEELETETDAKLIPDYYADSMGDFVEFMRDLNKSNA